MRSRVLSFLIDNYLNIKDTGNKMVIRFSIPARSMKLYYKNCVESTEDKALKVSNGETYE